MLLTPQRPTQALPTTKHPPILVDRASDLQQSPEHREIAREASTLIFKPKVKA